MKPPAPLLFLLLATGLCFSQTYQNRPDLTAPLLRTYVAEASVRGVEVLGKLDQLDSLKVGNPGGYAGASYEWIGTVDWITIPAEAFRPECNKALFLLMHEVGHLFGVDDCFECTYNVMSGNYSERAVFLSKDSNLKKWLFDNYFARIKNPKAPHFHY